MTNYLFSEQEVTELLSQLVRLRVKYPPELLATRRTLYLGWIAQMIATRISVNAGRDRWTASILREPGSTVVKVLIIIFVAFLIAFVAHAIATGNVNFGRLIGLLPH